MKKIGRIYGEAKINMREMIGNRENTTEPPQIKRQTKNIDDMRQHLKEIYHRMEKQSKTNLLSIEENELVGAAFDEYGVHLREEGDFGSLGDVFVSVAAFHQSIEGLRMRMNTALQTKVSNPFEEFISGDVKRARNEKIKYDKARVSFDALHNKAKQMKKKGSIDKVVEVERELEDYKSVFEDIALETVKVQSDVCEMHSYQTLERMCDYISIYEDFFTQGLTLAKQISKDLPAYRATIKELKEDFRQKKLQRGEEDESGAKMVFGVALEDIVARENNGTGVPAIMDHAIKYLYKNSLQVEGLFRVSGSQKEVMELKKKIERGVIDFSEVLNDHNISGILKLFLRELPTPIFPFNLYNPIIKVVQDHGKDEALCTRELKALIATIPPLNLNCLRYLLGLCHELTNYSSTNLMVARNLAVVLAPNILYSRDVSLEAVADSNGAIEFLVSHYKSLFPGNFQEWVTQPPVAVGAPSPATPSQSVTLQSTPRTPQQPPSIHQPQFSQPSPSPLSRPTPAPTTPVTPSRLPVSAPVAASPVHAVNPNNINPAAGKAPPGRRPAAVRGSSMFQFGVENNGEEIVPLRKASMGGEDVYATSYMDEPVVVNPTPPVPNPRASTMFVTPMYPPGQHPSAPGPSPVRKNPPAPGPSPKQLPPRPPGKLPPNPSLTLSSGQLPPPPSHFSSSPVSHSHSPSYSQQQQPIKTTSSPSLSFLTPPPPLSTPPLKSSSKPAPTQQDDLIQF